MGKEGEEVAEVAQLVGLASLPHCHTGVLPLHAIAPLLFYVAALSCGADKAKHVARCNIPMSCEVQKESQRKRRVLTFSDFLDPDPALFGRFSPIHAETGICNLSNSYSDICSRSPFHLQRVD